MASNAIENEIAKFDGASESNLQSTVYEPGEHNASQIDGVSYYIYEQFNK